MNKYNFANPVLFGVFKLIEFYEDMHIKLYNLSNDIEEKEDLKDKMPEKVVKLRALLHSYREKVGAKMPYLNSYYESE